MSTNHFEHVRRDSNVTRQYYAGDLPVGVYNQRVRELRDDCESCGPMGKPICLGPRGVRA